VDRLCVFARDLGAFNIGTNDGRACDPVLTERIAAICAASRWSHVVDGRFKGGWITCTYGRPADGIHAVQMELAMRGYLPGEGDPPRWDANSAKPIKRSCGQCSTLASRFPAAEEDPDAHSSRQCSYHPGSAWPKAFRQKLADRGAAADADE